MTDTEPEPTDTVRFHRDTNGQYRWTLRAAGNHEVIAASTESYVKRSAAIANYERVTGRVAPSTKEDPFPHGFTDDGWPVDGAEEDI